MARPRTLDNRGKMDRVNLRTLGIYSFRLNVASGTPTLAGAPSGWSVTDSGAGDFTITHGLALTAESYQVLASAEGDNVAAVTALATNSFDLNTWDLATPSAEDNIDVNCLLIVGDGE